MSPDPKSVYAQSSDIKARTYLEYRKDMKKKAIAELEVKDWLQERLKAHLKSDEVAVEKSGGDRFLWFLRKGGVTREPDFVAKLNGKELFIEFQYAEKEDLACYDFKVSKVATKKGKERVPIADKLFAYIHKPSRCYAFFSPSWIVANGEYGFVPAWRSYACRVPKDRFENILIRDEALDGIVEMIDAKNRILLFQHMLIDLWKEELSATLQQVVDEEALMKIMPKDLRSFFEVCFILDNLDKTPVNASLWLVYALTYVSEELSLHRVAELLFSIDFLYSKVDLRENELKELIHTVRGLSERVNNCARDDGTYRSSVKESPLEETRCALFSMNLLDDVVQDMMFYYRDAVSRLDPVLQPITRIYNSVRDVMKTHQLIEELHE